MSELNEEVQNETLTESCRRVTRPAGAHNAGCRPCSHLWGTAERHGAIVSGVPIAYRDAAALPAAGDAHASPFETDTGDTATDYPAEAFTADSSYGNRHFTALSAASDADATGYANCGANAKGDCHASRPWYTHGCAYATRTVAAWTEGGIHRDGKRWDCHFLGSECC